VKAFTILELLSAHSDGMLSLTEVARHLNVSKSTAHRYLTTMEELEVVRRNEKDCFGLGLKMIELAGSLLSQHDLRNESEPLLEQLCAQTQETAHLAIPTGNNVVYIAKVDSPLSIRMASHIGLRNPMHCTALGKAILAHYPQDKVEAIIREGLPSRTAYTLTSAEHLQTELERIRNEGFAIDDQENELGVRCAGAAIFDYTGKVIGAISVSGPASRISHERCLELGLVVSKAADEVSRKMGFHVQSRNKATLFNPEM
jgi:IclR family transcriptional regulator, KDG regulon repressor